MSMKPYSPRRKTGNTSVEDFGSVEFGGYIPDVTTTGTITVANGSTTVAIIAIGSPRGQLVDFKGCFFDAGLRITLSVATDVGCLLILPR